jgi:hypothetical protein
MGANMPADFRKAARVRAQARQSGLSETTRPLGLKTPKALV